MKFQETKINLLNTRDDWEEFKSSLAGPMAVELKEDEIGIAIYFNRKAGKFGTADYDRNKSSLTVYWHGKKEKIQADKDKSYLISLVDLDSSQVKFQIRSKPKPVKNNFFTKLFKR